MPRHKITFTCVECGEHEVRRGAAARVQANCPVCGEGPFTEKWTTHEPDEEAYRAVREDWC